MLVINSYAVLMEVFIYVALINATNYIFNYTSSLRHTYCKTHSKKNQRQFIKIEVAITSSAQKCVLDPDI